MSPASFDRDAAERIIRRAVELDDATQPPAPNHLSEAALREAAAELGIDVAAVRQAAAEERLGMNVPEQGIADRLVGPSRLLAVYPFECGPEEALERIDNWMRKSSGFGRVTATKMGAEYRRRTDAVAAVQRASRSFVGRERLASTIDRVEVLVEPLDDNTSLVALSVDRGAGRVGTLIGAGTVAGGGTIASIVLAGPITNAWWALLGIPVAIASGYGIGAGRKLALHETASNLSGVVQAIATEPSAGALAGQSAANAVKTVTGFFSKAPKRSKGHAAGAQTPPPPPRRAQRMDPVPGAVPPPHRPNPSAPGYTEPGPQSSPPQRRQPGT